MEANTNERYYTGMLRMMKEADMKEGKANAMQNAKRMIWVTFKKEGIHKYPAALDDPSLATGDEYDVSFWVIPIDTYFILELVSL